MTVLEAAIGLSLVALVLAIGIPYLLYLIQRYKGRPTNPASDYVFAGLLLWMMVLATTMTVAFVMGARS